MRTTIGLSLAISLICTGTLYGQGGDQQAADEFTDDFVQVLEEYGAPFTPPGGSTIIKGIRNKVRKLFGGIRSALTGIDKKSGGSKPPKATGSGSDGYSKEVLARYDKHLAYCKAALASAQAKDGLAQPLIAEGMHLVAVARAFRKKAGSELYLEREYAKACKIPEYLEAKKAVAEIKPIVRNARDLAKQIYTKLGPIYRSLLDNEVARARSCNGFPQDLPGNRAGRGKDLFDDVKAIADNIDLKRSKIKTSTQDDYDKTQTIWAESTAVTPENCPTKSKPSKGATKKEQAPSGDSSGGAPPGGNNSLPGGQAR